MRRMQYVLTSLAVLVIVVMFAACSDEFPVEDPQPDADVPQAVTIDRDRLLEWESEWMLADAMVDMYGIDIRQLEADALAQALDREATKAAADPSYPHPRQAVSAGFCDRLHSNMSEAERPADAVKWCAAMEDIE